MTRWIIEKSVGFTHVDLLRISESVRAYAYLILSSQASARSSIIGNLASSLTAQSAYLNNFENVVNRRVDIWEDIKRYQDTLSYALSKGTSEVFFVISWRISAAKGLTPSPLVSGPSNFRQKIRNLLFLEHTQNTSRWNPSLLGLPQSCNG